MAVRQSYGKGESRSGMLAVRMGQGSKFTGDNGDHVGMLLVTMKQGGKLRRPSQAYEKLQKAMKQ